VEVAQERGTFPPLLPSLPPSLPPPLQL
jgi:hypothetical protein